MTKGLRSKRHIINSDDKQNYLVTVSHTQHQFLWKLTPLIHKYFMISSFTIMTKENAIKGAKKCWKKGKKGKKRLNPTHLTEKSIISVLLI